MWKNASPKTIYLKDYQPPAWITDTVDLEFRLYEQGTRVISRLTLEKNPDFSGEAAELQLNGEGLKAIWLRLNGEELAADAYTIDEQGLVLFHPPAQFVLESEVELSPQTNTALEGLYRSGGMFCTQCEAEGFRRITWYQDRPDVMARFKVRIEADRARYPVLLSNGNPIGEGELPEGRHYAEWEDPFPKPSYLFALVAGDLDYIQDRFVTSSGRDVRLRIYVEPENIDKCDHAMRSLINAMRWDEEKYGREYDLDVFNIVAVNDFNMGAMENKGLNVFNAKYVLARPDTATDEDYQGIEAVIAHEYFHNWTGNRITCRDWFQLSLKEGFTVYRDQEFSADMGDRGVKRIDDVRLLRAHQFAEDASPMAHPVRPAAYMEINNFYTVTVYEKG
ncbi:MAG TPA: aminopeptidase N, partial [Chromatiaceae bacterium]|nr:aminopeptidase N [Chromatiaceae bacterium]